ncbi:vitamin B12-dependent ribonucleotide reductase [Youngiibacter fragilis]|uniref:Vitamin B12-dependent ribonucleotide reductase n=1 Tax=Youngiibacter fragilis 232.1 TaxID=994573 RepID=V7I2F2_9CLOT|nr:vitamin B12-dependent ribonucleotide reductase [Youngiibacter fragilis]ETA79461.1 vitamin B12-dependent ribonucleotide reductase [Youngiibacter fragilis 232.1]
MSKLKQLFKRYYTKELENNKEKTVYDLFDWEKRDVLLKDYKSGRILTEMRDLEFPSFYSQNAVDIIASKYFRKAGVPGELGYENSMRQVAHRMVSFWADALVDDGLIDTDEDRSIFYDEMVYGLLNQMYAPNSPQWFNTGLKQSYGISGGKNDLFYFDPVERKVVLSEDSYSRTQASACFILSVEDKLLGSHSISEQYVTETKLFKGGSGTGTNFSAIRGVGEKLSGGGVSSGLMSFLKGLDRNAGAIKSGGTTRRAAKMVCLDIDHPEIETFIMWKAKEEDKVRALAKMGYDADMDGEAYETVSGQNSNNSVRLTDEFMDKVMALRNDPDQEITLRGRMDERVNRNVKVKDLWDKFNEAAWKSADPAPQFTDTFNAWHTCPAGEDGEIGAHHNRLNSTNPCGEYAFLDDTSCNLASINLYKFYDADTNRFDVEGYSHIIGLSQLLLEGSIQWGQFPTEDIARKTYMFRTTGLGIANLASLLMALGMPYDSDEARTLAAALTGMITGKSYAVSAMMAEKVGPFEKFELNRPYMLRVIRNHARVAGALDSEYEGLHYIPYSVDHEKLEALGQEGLSETLKSVWTDALSLGEDHGYRNAQVSVIAPTGTISFAMDCAATSLEPFFSHVVYKKLVGGGFMTIANPIISVALKNLGYSPEETEDIMAYIGAEENGMVKDGKIEGAPHLKEEHYPIFDTANTCGTGKRYIHHMGHVLMVAALTPLVSGAISKTVNLPREATVEDFKDVVVLSWKTGVKGISLYRDGSKYAQPLNTRLDAEVRNLDLENLTYDALLKFAKEAQKKESAPAQTSVREKMKGIRAGHTHPAQIEDVKIYTTVNRNERGEISEIYITTDREGTLITGLLNSLSKTISVMLQYHIPPKDISRMLRGQKYEPYGFVSKHPYIKNVTSISDLISKVIDLELGDFSRVQVKPEADDLINRPLKNVARIVMKSEESPKKEDSKPVLKLETQTVIKDAEKNGEKLYDSVCPNCSSTRMVRNGTCKVCLDCGSTTGCS